MDWRPLSDDAAFSAPATADGMAKSIPPAFSDEALALRFAESHAYHLRYVAPWGKWILWNGTHWQRDDTLRAFDLARQQCRFAAATCNKPKLAPMIASAKSVAAVERLARADRRIAATVDQWDSDPWLLNTPDGVIDLRSGRRREHRQSDYMTKITSVGGGGESPPLSSISRADHRGRQGLAGIPLSCFRICAHRRYARTRVVLCLWNRRRWEVRLILNRLRYYGTYHRAAQIEAFTATHSDRHPTDLAGLQGARFVSATETEEGRRWAESRIKQLTGGDRIAARFRRQDFFEFRPTFKLVIAGNHKPSLRSVDEAIRRRFHLIPFAVTIPPDHRDPQLAKTLKSEWPGILQWMIDGRLEWRRDGLQPPKAVCDATAAYLDAEDAIASWINDKCERDPKAWAQSSDLFASWSGWAERAGEHAGSMKHFSQNLESRGFQRHNRNNGRGFYGLRLLAEPGWWGER